MIPAIQGLFTEDILSEALARYNPDPNTVRSLGEYESFVYEYRKNDSYYVLIITHTIR